MAFSSSKRTIILITSIVLLGVFLIVFTNPWSTLRSISRTIALKSASEVDRIVLADGYDSTALIRQDKIWLINGKEEAGKIPVENILIAAERMEISSIISKKAETASGNSRTITYSKGEKVVLSYSLQAQGESYLLSLPGSDQSFYVTVSGYPGLNLEKVFSAEVNHYREHLLIDLLPSEISTIEVELPDGGGYRFTQDREGEITCHPSGEAQALPSEMLNDLAIRLLFSYFTGIVYEDKSGIPISTLLKPDAGAQRLANLYVESFGGENHSLQVFPYVENPGEEAHMFKALVAYNDEPYALIVNYIHLDVLMRDLSVYTGEN